MLAYGKKPRRRSAERHLARAYRPPRKAQPVRTPRSLAREAGPTALPKRYRIKGKKASDLEWRVYQALLRLGWADDDIDFQVPVLGGRLAGGLLLDFVVWTPAMPVIIEPNGDYWHTATIQKIEHDRARRAKLQQAWTRPFRYYSLGSGELQSDQQAEHKLLMLIGRG